MTETVDEAAPGTPASFSIVMPTFNRGASIRESVDRVLTLDYSEFELIVVDDGSTDETAEVLAAIRDPRLHVVRRKNGGISAARNSGVVAARGKYVVPLDDDDLPGDEWLSTLSQVIARTDAAVVSSGFEIISARSGEVMERRQPVFLGPVFSGYTGCFLAGTFAVRRDLYLAVGGFTENLQSAHQTEFSMRVLRECKSRNLVVSHTSKILIQIVRRPADERPESSPAKLSSGTEWILEEHDSLLRSYPRTHASFLAIAGVNAMKLGDPRRGRRRLIAAWRSHPTNMRHAARALICLIPLLSRRVWVPTRAAKYD